MSSVTLNSIFRLSAHQDPAQAKLKSMEWAVLTQMDGTKRVKDISDVLAMSDEEILEIIDRLMARNLLEYAEQKQSQEKFLPVAFFEAMEAKLIRLIGPVASIIIDDVLIDIDKERTNVEHDRVSTLVESISEEIDAPEKKIEFQQQMLELMNSLEE